MYYLENQRGRQLSHGLQIQPLATLAQTLADKHNEPHYIISRNENSTRAEVISMKTPNN